MSATPALRAPFPYFGGKRRVAAEVWRRFGAVRSYVEPFFGSGAVLLARPMPFSGVETVNDLDGLLCNFWRALQADPAGVAKAADWPVSECDLHARHLWLVERRESITERLCADPDFHDVKAAGWWVWGAQASIMGNWLETKGVNAPPHAKPARRPAEDLHRLAARLRGVRVLCGDWSRAVASDAALHALWVSPIGVFLDPPYSSTVGRDMNCYGGRDSGAVAGDVRAWALDAGKRSDLRIALCGYDEHEDMRAAGWSDFGWSAHGGMAHLGKSRGKANRHRECVWFSPACIGAQQPGLFDVGAA